MEKNAFLLQMIGMLALYQCIFFKTHFMHTLSCLSLIQVTMNFSNDA